VADNITEKPMTKPTVVILISYLLAVTIMSAYLIVTLWQRQVPASDPPQPNCSKVTSPILTDIYPERVTVGSAGNVWLVGCGFTLDTKVKANGAPRSGDFVDSSHIRVGLTPAEVSTVGAIVFNGTPEFGSKALAVVPPEFRWWFLGTGPWSIHPEIQLLLLVLFTGVFGSTVYSLKSLGDYRGDNRLFESWLAFYLIQPFTGMGIAFLLYVVVRGGFLSGAGSDLNAVNQFGICAIAGLAGAFSDTAFLKIREVFMTMFKPQDDRGGKIGPRITTTTLSEAIVGEPYNQALQATGGVAPVKWSVIPDLPAPLVLDKETGVISGTPTSVFGKNLFKFTVTDSATPPSSTSVDFTFEIKAAALQVSTTELTVGDVGKLYSQTLQAAGGVAPLTWSVSPLLPAPLSLDPASGLISGSPTAALAKSPFKFTVADSATPPSSTSVDLTIEIK
jgi:hypothetical protein